MHGGLNRGTKKLENGPRITSTYMQDMAMRTALTEVKARVGPSQGEVSRALGGLSD